MGLEGRGRKDEGVGMGGLEGRGKGMKESGWVGGAGRKERREAEYGWMNVSSRVKGNVWLYCYNVRTYCFRL